jgi:predicted aldo/keto reductase-like oxidoreductase
VAAAAAVGAGEPPIGAKKKPDVEEMPPQARRPDIPYRTLGRTGMKASVIGFGTLRTREPAVMRAAFDRGVNWLDTARVYMSGKNEAICGEALKGYRDKVYVITKSSSRSKDGVLRDIEKSLRSLQTDHVDLFLMHSIDSKRDVMNEEVREVMVQLRKQGKTRFIGVSSHEGIVEVLDAVREDPDKFYDAALVKYNYESPKPVKEAIARAAKANIGVIAMKTQEGGYKTKELGDISPHQAALKWVLQDKNVTTTIPGMVSLQQVVENTEVMKMMKLTRVDEQILRRYSAAIAPFYCVGCGECKATCPKGVAIPAINRCLMYAEGYGDMELARSTYAELPAVQTASVCPDCSQCVAKCSRGLQIARKMSSARAMFA